MNCNYRIKYETTTIGNWSDWRYNASEPVRKIICGSAVLGYVIEPIVDGNYTVPFTENIYPYIPTLTAGSSVGESVDVLFKNGFDYFIKTDSSGTTSSVIDTTFDPSITDTDSDYNYKLILRSDGSFSIYSYGYDKYLYDAGGGTIGWGTGLTTDNFAWFVESNETIGFGANVVLSDGYICFNNGDTGYNLIYNQVTGTLYTTNTVYSHTSSTFTSSLYMRFKVFIKDA